jgi:Lambda phage tail tube protein, TTP
MSNALLGYDTAVAIGNAESPSSYTVLQEVTEVTPPNEQVDDVDVTHYKSPARTREFIPGLIDGGEAEVVMNRVPGSTTETLLLGLKTTGSKRAIKITWPNTVSWVFVGHVKGYATEAPVDGPLRATVTFKVDSNTSITIPSSLVLP